VTGNVQGDTKARRGASSPLTFAQEWSRNCRECFVIRVWCKGDCERRIGEFAGAGGV